jgi:hypothetical protein
MGLISTALRSSTTPRVGRLDAARLLCNMVTYYPPSRKAAVEAKSVAALADYAKTLVEEEDVAVVGKIMRELSNCEDSRAGMIQVQASISSS